jgi:hypothetical protein
MDSKINPHQLHKLAQNAREFAATPCTEEHSHEAAHMDDNEVIEHLAEVLDLVVDEYNVLLETLGKAHEILGSLRNSSEAARVSLNEQAAQAYDEAEALLLAALNNPPSSDQR